MTLYELQLVDPKTSRERTITVLADREAAEASPDWMAFVQAIAKPQIPANFMCIMGRVREVTRQ
jgi:hypothetical protein